VLNISFRKFLALGYLLGLFVLFVFVRTFWTPDIMFLALFGLFYILGQSKSFVIYFLPFVLLLLSYEKLRSLAPLINSHVHYMEMVHFDKWLFGGVLPTAWLQQHMYFGRVAWYDFYFYFLYMLHFVTPILLAVAIWKYRPKQYWLFITSLVFLSYAGFITYVLYPAAPPWMASDLRFIEPIHRISSDVWYAFGVKDFSSYYKQLAPNTVAAMPSLHAAYPFLLALFVRRIWGNRWFALSLIYPASIWLGVVYLGEHYVVDVLFGILYALLSYISAPYALRYLTKFAKKLDKYSNYRLTKILKT